MIYNPCNCRIMEHELYGPECWRVRPTKTAYQAHCERMEQKREEWRRSMEWERVRENPIAAGGWQAFGSGSGRLAEWFEKEHGHHFRPSEPRNPRAHPHPCSTG